ncbi:MAG: radical SAM protein [Chloroflexi bacterium]|nr:radical SAM protein [Chloroflexota bacterium]
MSLIDDIKDIFFTRHKPVENGIYHYQAPPDAPFPYRLHLRIEKDGEGILLVNASTVLHLNQTATEYAYHLVNQTPEETLAKRISRRYNISSDQALEDFRDFQNSIQTLIESPDLDPVTFLAFDRATPYSDEILAPYRLDCALTYQTIDTEGIESAPRERVARELTTEEWITIIDKAWDAGIPHLIFTGGEPTIRPDLAELIAAAEKNGQVTGLLTSGYRLTEHDYLETLLQNGLDHVMLVLQPDEDYAWEALRDLLAADIFVTVHLTISSDNFDVYKARLDRLTEMGVDNLSLSTRSKALEGTLQQVRNEIQYRNINLVWDLPVPYSSLNPVALEMDQDKEYVSGEGRAWLYVEPDGDVLPRQGKAQSLGNLLTDPWSEIWAKATEIRPG